MKRIPNGMETPELQLALDKAHAARRADAELREQERDAKKAAAEKITKQFEARRKASFQALIDAETAFEELLSKQVTPHPWHGKIITCEAEQGGRSWGSSKRRITVTALLITHKLDPDRNWRPQNHTRYPEAGDIILRYLTKAGELSERGHVFSRRDFTEVGAARSTRLEYVGRMLTDWQPADDQPEVRGFHVPW